jgi:hypothetical protein
VEHPSRQDDGQGQGEVTSERRVGNEGQKGTTVKGSKDDPRYVVESEKSGKQAAHSEGALEKK